MGPPCWWWPGWSNDSIPGSWSVDCVLDGLAMGGGGFGLMELWLATLLSWFCVYMRLSGCQVRLLQSSDALEVESRRAERPVDRVGDVTTGPGADVKTPLLALLTGAGPNMGRAGRGPGGDWKTWTAEGTLKRRPGVRAPLDEYMLWERECDVAGEAMPDAQRGLPWPVENVAEVGVPNSLGEGGRYWKGASPLR